MSREWQPGDVAICTQHPDKAVVVVKAIAHGEWHHPGYSIPQRIADTDVRPLVVLDPQAHRFYPELLVRALRAKTGYTTLANAIEAQACPPKPPKPTEPTGLGAVVEDAEGRKWLRVAWPNPWCLANPAKRKGGEGMTHGSHVEWGRVDAVRVLSEGVTDA